MYCSHGKADSILQNCILYVLWFDVYGGQECHPWLQKSEVNLNTFKFMDNANLEEIMEQTSLLCLRS